MSNVAVFDALLAEYWSAYFEYYPEIATVLGVHGHNQDLNPCSDAAEAAKHALAEQTLVALEAIDPSTLDADRGIDWRVLQGQLWITLDAYARWDWRVRDPMAFLPTDAIYQLTARPVPDFVSAISARLSAVPAHLAQAQVYLSRDPAQIPPLWLDLAQREAVDAIAFLADLPQHPKVRAAELSLGAPIAAAQQALRDYASFLDDLRPQACGSFAAGQAHFELLLRYRHGLHCDLAGLKRLGQRLLAETRAALQAVTRELRGDSDVAAMTATLQTQHPSASQLLEAYRSGMAQVNDFVRTRGLVTLPAPERLDVIETPLFLRQQVPFAAYMEPSPQDPQQQGYYYVTPVTDDSQLAEHHWTGILHTCAHEAYPGHHLQFVTANRQVASRSYARLLNASATLYEGWALYCEQLMVEQGLLNQPENRFVLLKDRLWRCLRILIDIGIHSEAMPLEQAADLLVSELGFHRDQALGELAWYSQAPTVPMGYATGWAIINSLRQSCLPESADSDALRGFHDQLLGVGSVALPWVIERAFGHALAEQAQQRVFAA